ncbi:MAG: hypothetical protein JSW51_04545 [Gemmatimonadota bacterium]|nr:MAG: hypothetical protein JSW51_04545 [Gemmatimonadota bacterium]
MAGTPGYRVRARVNLNPSVAVGSSSEHRFAPRLSLELAEIGWKTNATELTGLNGFRGEVICPPGGTAAAVWGTEVYAGESSICTAAVHAGLISFRDGGTVTFEIFPGVLSYEGTERNGVASRFASQSRGGGFRFVPRTDADEGG